MNNHTSSIFSLNYDELLIHLLFYVPTFYIIIRKMKKVRKEKRKLAERYVLKMSHESDYIEQNDDELFSLAAVKDLVGLEESNKLSGDTSNTGVDDLAREQIDAALKAKRKRLADEWCSAVEGKKRVHFERRSGNQSDEHLSDSELFGEIYGELLGILEIEFLPHKFVLDSKI